VLTVVFLAGIKEWAAVDIMIAKDFICSPNKQSGSQIDLTCQIDDNYTRIGDGITHSHQVRVKLVHTISRQFSSLE